MKTKTPTVLLDRDGVINQDRKHSVRSVDELHLIPGSMQALGLLKQNGYKTLVITNQACIGRKILRLEVLDAIHQKIQENAATAGGFLDQF